MMTSGFNHTASGGGFYKINTLAPHGSIKPGIDEPET